MSSSASEASVSTGVPGFLSKAGESTRGVAAATHGGQRYFLMSTTQTAAQLITMSSLYV